MAEDIPENVSLAMMRRRVHGSDVYRAMWEGTYEAPDLFAFYALLGAQEYFPQWLPMVEGSEVLESLDLHTRLCRTRFKFGWPASPRDAVVLAHQRQDASTLLHIATSVPRSNDAPSYLRPAPPYVRAHIHIMAVLIHRITPSRLAVTAYWSLDPRGSVLGVRPTAVIAGLPQMLPTLAECVQTQGTRIPWISAYSRGMELTSQRAGSTWHLAYSVLDDEQPGDTAFSSESSRENVTKQRSVWIRLHTAHGWDVRISIPSATPSSRDDEAMPYTCELVRLGAWYEVVIEHAPLPDEDTMMRVRVDIQCVDEHEHVRINGVTTTASSGVMPTLAPQTLLKRLVASDAASVASTISEEGPRRISLASSGLASSSLAPLAATVRRNYIYFTSLLQEPEAKWTRVTDTRGVTVTQLDSIDPTLVVYRAEATFVGLTVWDLYSILHAPTLAPRWTSSVEKAHLLHDFGGQSTLWHVQYPSAWPVSARDAVLVQTSYQSPTSVHVFSFSADEHVDEYVPPPAPSTIRTQVDLYGWSIEALSPTTVHVTLIEQSDPRGWLSKSRVPTMMVAAMAGAGEYALKQGGPPMVTRLLNARIQALQYDDKAEAFEFEYKPAPDSNDSTQVECELRCNLEAWAPNLDIKITPPPSTTSCLRRHRLAEGGGGLWLTVEHRTEQLAGATVHMVVRKGPVQSVERGVVLLNGTRLAVDTDTLDAAQVQALVQQKRIKPQRVPLDLRKPRAATSAASTATPADEATTAMPTAGAAEKKATSTDFGGTAKSVPLDASSARPPPSPSPSLPPQADALREGSCTNLPHDAMTSTQQPRPALAAALQALFLLRRINADRPPDPAGAPSGWTLLSEKRGLFIRRRMMESLSETVAVHRTEKIVQGVAADELLRYVAYPHVRAQWDESLARCDVIESYGQGATTSVWTTQASFPFRARAFVVGHVTAYGQSESADGATSPTTQQPVYFHASASVDADVPWAAEAAQRYAPALPVGRVLIDGWIFEPVDPYSTAQYPIPSTRCTHIVAIDYAGGLPSGVNAWWNASLPRALTLLEQCYQRQGPLPSIHAPPNWLRVRGDARDDDRTLLWRRGRVPRWATILTCDYAQDTRTLHVLAYVGRSTPSVKEATQTVEPSSPGSTLRRVSSTSSPTPLPVSTSMSSLPETSTMTATATITSSPSRSSLRTSTSTGALSANANGYPRPASASAASLSNGVPSSLPHPRRLSSHSAPWKRVVSSGDASTSPALSTSPQAAIAAHTTCIAEVHVELQHYPHGYAVDVTWANAPTPPTPCDVSAMPTQLPNEHLPLHAQILDMPPSALQVATHSSTTQPHRHAVRVIVPTEILERRHLSSTPAALVRLQITPLRGPADGPAVAGHVPVTCNGRVGEILYGHEVTRTPSFDIEADELERVPRGTSLPRRLGWAWEDDLQILAQPAAVRPPPPAAPSTSASASASPSATASETSATATARTKSTPGAGTHTSSATEGKEADTSTTTSSPASTSAPFFGLLGRRPYTSLSSLVSRATSSTTPTHATSTPHVKDTPASAPSRRASQTQAGAALSQEAESDVSVSQPVPPRTFRLTTLILIVIVSFLAGSLFRSLLEPVDFILVPQSALSTGAGAEGATTSTADTVQVRSMAGQERESDVRSMLNVAAREIDNFVRAARQLHAFTRLGYQDEPPTLGVGPRDILESTPMVRWRELRRFFDFRVPGLPWYLVLGWARA